MRTSFQLWPSHSCVCGLHVSPSGLLRTSAPYIGGFWILLTRMKDRMNKHSGFMPASSGCNGSTGKSILVLPSHCCELNCCLFGRTEQTKTKQKTRIEFFSNISNWQNKPISGGVGYGVWVGALYQCACSEDLSKSSIDVGTVLKWHKQRYCRKLLDPSQEGRMGGCSTLWLLRFGCEMSPTGIYMCWT